MPLTIGNIELYMGPSQHGAPDDLKKVIVDFIDKAQKRLYVAVQELDNADIAEALIRARQRKVLVKLVLEHDYLRQSPALAQPFEPGGATEENRRLHAAILRANIDVKPDYNTSIFHQKFMVRDGESVLTGSTNFTDTGTSANLNHIVVVHDPQVALIYSREFREIQQGHFGALNEGHGASPDELTVSGVPIKILFAPDHAPEMEMMKQMLKARSRIDFAIFTFAQSSGIDDTMLAQAKQALKIKGALDAQAANQTWAATHQLKGKANIKLWSVGKAAGINKLHHKLMVLDKRVVICGSFNYTGPANQLNDENIMILGSFDEASESSKAKQKKIGEYCVKEIERIIDKFGKKI